jgi:hypothetical protein
MMLYLREGKHARKVSRVYVFIIVAHESCHFEQVDKLIDRNWRDDLIVKEAIEPSNRGRPKSSNLPDGQSS